MDLIEENLWLGCLSSATDLNLLRENNIKSILTIEVQPLPAYENIAGLFIKAQDDPSHDLLCSFNQAHEFIDEGRQKGGVLVHCFHGVSRSATLIISYLQKRHSIPRDEALERVQLARPSVMPNEGFMAQLLLYEEHLNLGTFDTIIMKWYHLQRLSKIYLKSEDDLLILYPQNCRARSAIKCKQCRIPLFDSSDVVLHAESKVADWRDNSWIKAVLSNKLESSGCKKGLFVVPSPWMKAHASPQGKILCPKCHSKLGSFSWNQPVECPCSAKFKPAFHIIPSKVDLAIKLNLSK